MTEPEYDVYVGVDLGSESHQLCALTAEREIVLERAVRHSGDALGEAARELLDLVGGDSERIALAVEAPHGAIVEMMVELGVAVFAINPKQLDRFRDRHSVAGAKDDRRDAFVLGQSLRTDRPCFKRVRLPSAELARLRELSRAHEDFMGDLLATANRLSSVVRRYFPSIVDLGSFHDSPWIWALLDAAPTPEAARRLQTRTVRRILDDHRIKRLSVDDVVRALRAKPVTLAPGVQEACVQHVQLLLPLMRVLHRQEREIIRSIRSLLRAMTSDDDGPAVHRDARLLQTLPGIGPLGCATMLAEAWEPLSRRDYANLRVLFGCAPVTKQSGKQRAVSMRRACNPRLRDVLHNWVLVAIQREPRARAHYRALRARGHSHGRATRGVADRLLAMLAAVLRQGTGYDPSLRQTAA